MVTLKAIRPRSGDYGVIAPGQTFQADQATAIDLESRGLAERAPVVYQHKMLAKSPEDKMVTRR